MQFVEGMEQKKMNKRKTTILYLIITLLLTWLCQFMPIMMGMDVENTSISSFDYSSIFFGIGGVMPTLIGVIFVFLFYTKEGVKDFLNRCFIPNKECIVAILISLGLVCLEVAVTQLISKGLGAETLGFEGLKLIVKNPILGLSFIVSCMSAALVYTTIYVMAKRRVFAIFFLHMFKNIILTGAMIYPFSETYSVVVVPVEIVLDVVFYLIITHTKLYKIALENVPEFEFLK